MLNTEFMVGTWDFPQTTAPIMDAGPHFYHFMCDGSYSWEFSPEPAKRTLTRPRPFRWEGNLLILVRGKGESRLPVQVEPDGSLCAIDPFGNKWWMRKLSEPSEAMVAFVGSDGKLQRLKGA